MIRIKHFMDAVDPDERERIWVEPINLTRDLREWCSIQHVLPHLGPPMELWRWYEEHPDSYGEFRGRYHDHLSRGPYVPALRALAGAAMREDFTLVHQSEDPAHNTATALYEFLTELEAYCPPET